MTWPPQEWSYNVSPVTYDIDVWDVFLKSVKMSIRAMGDNAFYIVAIFVAFSVMVLIIKRFTGSTAISKGVFNRSLSRKIFEADFAKNSESMIEDSVLRKKLNVFANIRFHDRHKSLLVQDRVNNMEVSHLAEQAFHKKFPNAFEEKKNLGKENAKKYYSSRKGKK